ncbi:hypothetical protein CMV_012440 [Castanea mollissima]|uniref:Protein kinase domain-containing protein n=1 Tax=Castanea mollissima TaxID=60419 RepID=A0A8J4R1X8_9ROSI|nr:hypothetical protein CMV_012440 [Castanea mollissima]
MYLKVSDFGIAKSFGGDQVEAKTNRIIGTYGCMSLEYAMQGRYSIKSDVFSFGVLILEIVSGKKNWKFCQPGHHLNLLGYAWRLWIEYRPTEMIDDLPGFYTDSTEAESSSSTACSENKITFTLFEARKYFK